MMTAANVVLVLATSLFIVVISGREKANALVFPLSIIFFCMSAKLAVTEYSKRSLYFLGMKHPCDITKLRFTGSSI